MCWVGCSKRLIADKDIPCFKIMRMLDEKTVESLYFHKLYTFRKTYRIHEDFLSPKILSYFNQPTYEINVGYHSYNPTVEVKYTSLNQDKSEFLIQANKPFNMLDTFCTFSRICKVECIIPKGSTYYLNKYGEYVSNKIKPVKILEKYFKDLDESDDNETK